MKRRRLNATKCRRPRSQAVDRILKLKVKYNFSADQLRKFVHEMYNREEAEVILLLIRKEFKNDGYSAHRLHGCAGCDDFIWLYSETMVCPNCNNLDGRYFTILLLRFVCFLLCFLYFICFIFYLAFCILFVLLFDLLLGSVSFLFSYFV